MFGSSVRRRVLFTSILTLLGAFAWAQPAAAFHIRGIAITAVQKDSIAGSVDIDVVESSGTPFGTNFAPNVLWGDGSTNYPPWTSNFTSTGAPGLNFHKVSVSHMYPDLTTRTITVVSDCCVYGSPAVDTVVIDFNCADTPMAGCRTAGKAQFQMKNNLSDDTKDLLKFKWGKGAETLLAALGDPTASTQYHVCTYAPGLVLEATIPADAVKWKVTGTKGFSYADKTGAAGGITKLKLKAGAADKASVQVLGKGSDLDDPGMPLTQPVTVQVQNSIGECWEHAFTAPEKSNTSEKFFDKEP